MKVKIKKLNKNAVIPAYSKDGDAGLDFTAISKEYDFEKDVYVYGTGLALEVPSGYVALLFPRSSIDKTAFSLVNSVGVLDSGYRGEVLFKFAKSSCCKLEYEIGERVGQMIILPYPKIELIESDELTESERGDGGFGSTGK